MVVKDKQARYAFQLLTYLAAAMLFVHISSAALTATPSPFTLSNTTIDVGQISIANTVVSGGSNGPYFGQWTWLSSNMINAGSVSNTITVGSNPIGISFNPSGTLAYVTNFGSDTVNVINPSTNTVINTITVGSDPDGVSFNPSGTLAYVTNYVSGTVNVINPSTNTVVNTITVGSSPYGVVFNPSGTLAYVANYGSGTVNVINPSTNTVINTITVGSNPIGVSFNPSGTLAYVTNHGTDTVNVINPSTNTVINTITVGPNPIGISFNPSGTLAYVANEGSDTVNVINPSTNTVINTITVGTSPIGVSFNPSGTLAYVTNYNSGTISIISNMPTTAQQPIPASNDLQLILNAVSSNELSLTFNGVTYTGSTGTNLIYGSWHIYGFASDSNILAGSDGGYASETFYDVGNILLLSNTLTINPALSTPIVSPSNPVIDGGQPVTFSSTWSGGTPDYTAKLYSSTTSTCNTGSTLVQTLSSLTSGSATFTAVSPTAATYYCIFVTDSATTPVTINSINSEITINPAMTAPSISPSNPIISSGQSVTFNATWSGGTPTYGASLYSSSNSTCNQQSTLIQQTIGISTNTITFSPVVPSSNFYYCVYVTDNSLETDYVENALSFYVYQPSGVAISPSGAYAYVASQGDNNVVIVNTANGEAVGTINSGFSKPEYMAFSPNGEYAYVPNANSNNVVIINTATNTITGAITSGISGPSGVAFSPNGANLYVVNGANVIAINTSTNTVTNSILSFNYLSGGIAISKSGTYAYISNYLTNNVFIVDLTTNTVTGSITPCTANPQGIAFAPSGTYAYVANCNGLVTINTATNTIVGSLNSGMSQPAGIAFSPDGSYAYITNGNNDNVIVVNPGISTTNSINSYVTFKSTTNQVSNPYAGGSTGFFGHLPGATTTATSSTTVSTTSTISAVTTATSAQAATSGKVTICDDISGYSANYSSLNATFNIGPGTGACFNMTATDVTSRYHASNSSVLKAINYTSSNKNISISVTIRYKCSLPSSDITPFILNNSAWHEITPFTVNVAACTVTFAVPTDPVIALINTNSTTPAATPNTTTLQTTTVPAALPQQPDTGIIAAAIVIVIIILAILAYLRSRR